MLEWRSKEESHSVTILGPSDIFTVGLNSSINGNACRQIPALSEYQQTMIQACDLLAFSTAEHLWEALEKAPLISISPMPPSPNPFVKAVDGIFFAEVITVEKLEDSVMT